MPHKKVKKALSKVKKTLIPKRFRPKKPVIRAPARIPVGRPRGVPPARLSPWWAIPSLVANIWHYGTHPEVKEWWRKEGENVGKAFEELYFEYGLDVPQIDPDSPLFIPEGYSYDSPMAPRLPEAQRVKRKVSKANKATSRAYKFLKKGIKGKMTQKKCCQLLKRAQSMASKANPNTKSRIGKGRSKNKTECRRMRKSLWGTTKRY